MPDSRTPIRVVAFRRDGSAVFRRQILPEGLGCNLPLNGLLVIGVFTLLLLRGVTAAAHADRFGALLATGIVCWLAAQGFENLGMNLGLLPVTGVPLPFVSYGGSSVIAAWLGVGLLTRVSRQ